MDETVRVLEIFRVLVVIPKDVCTIVWIAFSVLIGVFLIKNDAGIIGKVCQIPDAVLISQV